jgi:hypothetical protein
MREQEMQRDVSVRCLRLRLSVLAFRPALANADAAFIPENVGPAQRENLRKRAAPSPRR